MLQYLGELTMILLCLFGPVPKDKGTDPSPKPESKPPQLPTPDFLNDKPKQETAAEALLRELQRPQHICEPIAPASGGPAGWLPSHTLLPEGTILVDRAGRLVKDGAWWAFSFDAPGSDTHTRILPNTTLEMMLRTTAGATEPVSFVVSGEATVYENKNYLLLQLARRALDDTPTRNAADESQTDDTSVADGSSPTDQPLAEASADEVADALRRERLEPDRILTPEATLRSTGQDASLPEGTPIVNRPGRLVKQGDWWTFVFESDHADHPEPPLRLLPNQSLELMTAATREGSNGLVFMVSGEVTAFEGENYLLARMALRRIDTGNLRR